MDMCPQQAHQDLLLMLQESAAFGGHAAASSAGLLSLVLIWQHGSKEGMLL
jgi:hypothetical protein